MSLNITLHFFKGRNVEVQRGLGCRVSLHVPVPERGVHRGRAGLLREPAGPGGRVGVGRRVREEGGEDGGRVGVEDGPPPLPPPSAERSVSALQETAQAQCGRQAGCLGAARGAARAGRGAESGPQLLCGRAEGTDGHFSPLVQCEFGSHVCPPVWSAGAPCLGVSQLCHAWAPRAAGLGCRVGGPRAG